MFFKEIFAEYIKSNMAEHGWKLKDMARESTLSDSTVHSYILGKINNPSEENMLLIVKAFGHGPDTIQKMRQQAAQTANTVEKKLVNAADDKQRMELFAEIVKTSVSKTLEEYRLQATAQQKELEKNTEEHLEVEQQNFKARTEEVVRQCNAEIQRVKDACDEKLKMMESHCNQRVSDIKNHMNDIIAEKVKTERKTARQNRISKDYLKSSIQNLCIAVVLLTVTNVFFGAYAVFAYTTFDMNDPSRGLHRETHSIGPLMLFLAIMLVGGAVIMVIFFLAKRHKSKKLDDDDDE